MNDHLDPPIDDEPPDEPDREPDELDAAYTVIARAEGALADAGSVPAGPDLEAGIRALTEERDRLKAELEEVKADARGAHAEKDYAWKEFGRAIGGREGDARLARGRLRAVTARAEKAEQERDAAIAERDESNQAVVLAEKHMTKICAERDAARKNYGLVLEEAANRIRAELATVDSLRAQLAEKEAEVEHLTGANETLLRDAKRADGEVVRLRERARRFLYNEGDPPPCRCHSCVCCETADDLCRALLAGSGVVVPVDVDGEELPAAIRKWHDTDESEGE